MPEILGPNGRPLKSTRPAGGVLHRNWWHWARSAWTTVLRNLDTLKLDDFEDMLKSDETCKFGIWFLKLAALSRIGDYTHGEGRVESFVRDTFAAMRGTVARAGAGILSALPYGYSVTEIVWRPEGNRTVIEALEPVYPRSIGFVLDTEEGSPTKNQVLQILQWPRQSQQVDLTATPHKVVHYVFDSDFGNPYGQSILKAAWVPWFIKKALRPRWGTTMERYGAPWTIARTTEPTAVVEDPETGEQVRVDVLLNRMLEQMAACGSFVTDKDTEIDFQQVTGRSLGTDFENTENHWNKMIFRALFVPSLLFDTGKGGGGAYALGAQHFDVFVLFLEWLVGDLVETLIEQLVRPLVELNFGRQRDYGTFQVYPFREKDIAMWSSAVAQLTGSGFLLPGRRDDMEWVRETIGAPTLKEDDPFLEQPPPDPTDAQQAGDSASSDGHQRPPSTRAPHAGSRSSPRTHRADLGSGILL